MAEARLDIRKRQVDAREVLCPYECATEDASEAPLLRLRTPADGMNVCEQGEEYLPGDRFVGTHHPHSTSFGGSNEDLVGEPTAVFLLHGAPRSSSVPTMIPVLRDSRLLSGQESLSVSASLSGTKECLTNEHVGRGYDNALGTHDRRDNVDGRRIRSLASEAGSSLYVAHVITVVHDLSLQWTP